MKKTIMLAAVAATLVTAVAEAADPLYSWTWTKDGLQTAAGNSDSAWSGINGIFSYTSGNEYATIGNPNVGGSANIISNVGGDFTLSFDLKFATAPSDYRTLISIASKGSATDTRSLQLQYDGSGFSLYNMGGYGQPNATSTNQTVGSTGAFSAMTDWVNISIVSDVSNTQTLTLYVDGKSVGSLSNWGPSSNDSSEDFSPTGIAFGRAPVANTRVFNGAAHVNNIKFYDSALNPAAAIPEPATATLSLLALAGLATRRRRK